MRKKIAVYAITALLMGFAVMMLPLSLQTETPTNSLLPPIPQQYKIIPDGANEAQGSTRDTFGQAPQDILPSSFILLTGLIVALTAYIFFKKQMIQQ
jgi:hypothetical protein